MGNAPDARVSRSQQVDYKFELKELFRRSDLIKYLTISSLKSGHRELVLGQLWWLLEPVFSMLIFVFLVQVVFKRSMPNYAVFVFCAILPFRWFTQAISQGQSVLTGIGGLMKDVAFPKAVYPIALTLSNFFNFLVGFVLLFALMAFFEIPPTVYWLWIPVLMLQFGVMTLGASLLISGLTVMFQDLKNIMAFVLQILFYMSPTLYTIEQVPDRYRHILMLNPLSIIFTSWREVLMYGKSPDLFHFGLISVFSVLLLCLGFIVFTRLEKLFPKIL